MVIVDGVREGQGTAGGRILSRAPPLAGKHEVLFISTQSAAFVVPRTETACCTASFSLSLHRIASHLVCRGRG